MFKKLRLIMLNVIMMTSIAWWVICWSCSTFLQNLRSLGPRILKLSIKQAFSTCQVFCVMKHVLNFLKTNSMCLVTKTAGVY